jgi:hypothetical protein
MLELLLCATAMGWLQQHLESFVKPVLGYIPTLPTSHVCFFTPEEMTVIKNVWRAVKAEVRRTGKPLLLPGRDVYIFEVLARREGFPTTFRPDISRLTVPYLQEDYSGYYLLDTGFMGSIPRALKCTSYTMTSASNAEAKTWGSSYLRRKEHQLLTEDTGQVFPRMKGARSLALKIERTPKYWKRGFYRKPCCKCESPALYYNLPSEFLWEYHVPHSSFCHTCCRELRTDHREGIFQEQSDPEEFLQAALLTIEIYTSSAPRFVNAPVEVQQPAMVYLG